MIIRTRAYLEQILESIGRSESYAFGGFGAFFESTLLQDGIRVGMTSAFSEVPYDIHTFHCYHRYPSGVLVPCSTRKIVPSALEIVSQEYVCEWNSVAP